MDKVRLEIIRMNAARLVGHTLERGCLDNATGEVVVPAGGIVDSYTLAEHVVILVMDGYARAV